MTSPSLQSIGSPAAWIGFTVFVLAMLVLDLGVFHRRAHVVRVREALAWTTVWIVMSLSFGVFVLVRFGEERGLELFAGYLIEKALSVDNLFVFLVIYLFGGFLIFTGVKFLVAHAGEVHPEKNPVLRLFRRLVPAVPDYRGSSFTIVEAGRRHATPLLMVLVVVEATDIVFAVDSIPAIFAVTGDPFIVYSSNIFAMLGLRALYFVLAAMLLRLRYLKVGLGLVLAFVGCKMLAQDLVRIPIAISLGVIAALIAGSVAASVLRPPRKPPLPSHPPHDSARPARESAA